MKPCVYIETSVISYLTSRHSRDLIIAANQQATQEWWEKRLGNVDVYISQMVVQEVSNGNDEAVTRRLQSISGFPLLEITSQAVDAGRDPDCRKSHSPAGRRGRLTHCAGNGQWNGLSTYLEF